MISDGLTLIRRARARLTPGMLLAGAEYLAALRAHGLDPQALCWMYHVRPAEMRLALVTSLVDRVGPGEVYDALFKAYDAAVTPKEIDPFIVTAYSPASLGGADLVGTFATMHGEGPYGGEFTQALSAKGMDNLSVSPGSVGQHDVVFDSNDPRVILGPGIYVMKQKPNSASQDMRQWKRFTRKIEELAA